MRETKVALPIDDQGRVTPNPENPDPYHFRGNIMTPAEIRALRLARGWSRADMSRRLDPPVDRTTIWRWETGRTHPERWELAQLREWADQIESSEGE